MSGRISTREVTARLQSYFAGLTPAELDVYVGSVYDNDYATKYPTVLPALWVGGQRQRPLDDGHGVTGRVRQRCSSTVSVRAVFKRFDEGVVDPEDQLNELFDHVTAALFGWTPTNARYPLSWLQSEDGPPSDPMCYVDMYFTTEVLYQKDVS